MTIEKLNAIPDIALNKKLSKAYHKMIDFDRGSGKERGEGRNSKF